MKKIALAGVTAVAALTAGVAVIRARTTLQRRRQLRRREIRELSSFSTTVGGCRVSARTSADALGLQPLPVILVHGFGVSNSYLMPTAERLATEFAVYAPDLPGHGRSETPKVPLNVSQLADSLIDWMDAVGLQRAALVGHSMGCQVAVDAAVRFPDRVDRLVLVAPTPDPAARTAAAQFKRFLIGGRYERVSLNAVLVADYLRMGRRLIPEFRFMLADPIEDKLTGVTAPLMLVRGEKDPIVPQRWLDEAARRTHANCIAVIEGWGHAVNYSAAPQLVDAIAPFLKLTSSSPQQRTQ